MNKDFEFVYELFESKQGTEFNLEVMHDGKTFAVSEDLGEFQYMTPKEFKVAYPDLSFLVTEPEKFDEYGYYGENNGPLPMSNPGDKMYD